MIKKIISAVFWLCAWQLLAVIVHNKILLVGPIETLQALAYLLPTADFRQSLLYSLLRIGGGFLVGTALGVVLAVLADRRPVVADLLSPLVHVLKSVPVASFVILLLIWTGNNMLSFWIVLLVVFPIMYLHTKAAFGTATAELIEMAEVYHMPLLRRLYYIYLPEMYPALRGALALALGMSWKSGVAAEVIGQPLLSVGNALYRSKVNLATDELLAWTLVIIFVSFLIERVCLLIFSLLDPKRRGKRKLR